MRNRNYDEEFKLDCIKYCAEHPDLSQVEAARNLGIPEQTLNRWLVNSRKQGEDAFRGSGNYASDKDKEIAPEQKKKNAEVQQQITDIHKDSKQIYGAPKIAKELKKKGCGTSERTVSVYMKEMGLKACWIKKWHAVPKVKLDSTKLKNLLKQKFNPKRPDSVWCTGITYIWTSKGFMYLSTIMDLFSSKIIAWELSQSMEEEFVIKTVEKAKAARKIRKPLIIHSDRGSHYKADAYLKATAIMKRSYSKVHYTYDNACIESFHSLIKREWLYRFQIQGYDHCRSLVFEYIETFYNTKRIHSHCGFISPNEFEEQYQNKKSVAWGKKPA